MAATSTSDTAEGPVLSVITKRLRSLRKKHNRILQMEESLSQGKTLNKEQQEVLRSKSSVLALIDELEKLRAPLSTAIDEELSLSLSSKTTPEQDHQPPPPLSTDAIKDLLNLIYFGSLFDVKPQSDFTSLMLTRTHERGCCLTYDYVTDDDTHLLGERDLDLISAVQGLMISRPVDSTLSHQDALEKCVEHAKRWLANSDEPVDPQSSITYAGLRERLHKIMASDYFTATPQMTGPGEVVAAAAVGNFGSFQVPMHESMVSVEVPVDGSVGQYQETEENPTSHEEYVTVENQSGTIEEYQKEDLERENSPEVVSAQAEQEQWQAEGERDEEGHRHIDLREQQYGHRRGQRGGAGRGGRRGNGRGRGSGRGGGPYQNGRSNQYYDNYYYPNPNPNPNPRNVYYNRRGSGRGAGGGGGGNSYYNHPSAAAQGNHAQADVGVAS